MNGYRFFKRLILLCLFGFLIHCQGKNTSIGPELKCSAMYCAKTTFSDLKPLFQNRCALCHELGSSGAPKINWLDYSTAKSYAENGQFYNRIWEQKSYIVGGPDLAAISPIATELLANDELVIHTTDGKPTTNAFITDEDRKLIVKWVEDGALE